MKKSVDLKEFTNTLPYASEIFGVYQPLLGWKSQRIQNQMDKGFYADKFALMNTLAAHYKGNFQIHFNENSNFDNIGKINIAEMSGTARSFNTAILNEIRKALPVEQEITPEKWKTTINAGSLNHLLNTSVKEQATRWMSGGKMPVSVKTVISTGEKIQEARIQSLKDRINRESVVAGLLLDLVKNEQFDYLKQIFYKSQFEVNAWIAKLQSKNPLDYIDPKKELDRVGLSPIGIVHLFRQYFYEFDTFLGTPVGHIWLSPGSSVELIELSSRKTIVEKELQMQTENVVKTEAALTEQDEISDAVKEENRNETKFGASVTAQENWIWGSSTQSASFDMNSTQQTAREQAHKHMRQQSSKLSTEIRKNYKSTFKTTTEYTDTTSKRYSLVNNTEGLINYELRRKMRQVGVQVQDVGTYLCWQTYVDEPGAELGIANLVHVAKSPETDNIPNPEQIVPKKPFIEKVNIQIPFIPVNESTSDNDQGYTHGAEYSNYDEYIEYEFLQKVICKEAEYYLADVVLQPQGADAKLSVRDFDPTNPDKSSNKGTFTVHLDYVHFHGQNTINIEATLYWEPNQDLNALKKEDDKKLAQYTAKKESAYRKEFVDAARDRIKAASNIQPRKYEELREEERIVIYRRLIQDLLAPENIIPQPDDRTRHIVSELINSIFDVDKMLYFVAPEWWKPREHYNQTFGALISTGKAGSDGKPEMKPNLINTITSEDLVGWGGINEARADNYYITEESIPAKLGSSLGWLLQLDGDNMRNAFLNAPWVKAVIPIRPGKEKAALNWLKQIEGVNGITENDMYTGDEPDLQGKTMLQVLEILAEKVTKKHTDSMKTSSISDPEDADNKVTATPVDKVYEHGFYPLQGGFKANVGNDDYFEVFDQWVEILPTDQVAAVEVKYDPKSGRQVDLV
ncbi:hypothetical protein [Nitrosomonas communis]|uniref:Uncharacterized protein n=1 Tax=Nitrosomonas communis TaxID=44574 RepID=A0A1I4LU24_9PROT|nr:hypothetical protein [Nitrosomonas communis]SFL94333.1 hypothetical protein SAMN05421863_100789 [Nitrosomonas communis]